MNLLHCYEILGLKVDAELATIKQSYRRLARRFHPDVNAGDRQAQERFIQINKAYQVLMQAIPESLTNPVNPTATAIPTQNVAPHKLSALDHKLKWQSHQTLQKCLRQGRFARAIALTEGLAQRLPDDAEVRQWQGIIYLSWGDRLLRKGKQNKARTYLRKALLADPHNQKLRQQIERKMATIQVSAV